MRKLFPDNIQVFSKASAEIYTNRQSNNVNASLSSLCFHAIHKLCCLIIFLGYNKFERVDFGDAFQIFMCIQRWQKHRDGNDMILPWAIN